MKFTEEQKKVLNLNKGQHLVLAAPGTGKTELLSNRLIKALRSGLKEEDIVCLTFTNRAAKNMKERIEKDFKSDKVFIGNIHNFCFSFLMKNNLIPKNTSLLDVEDTELLLKEIISLYNENLSINDLQIANTFLKQKKLDFEQELLMKPEIKNLTNKIYKMCYEYESIKKESNFLDFDDLLILTYDYLRKNEIQPFKWIQIDEVQDLNPLQWAIVNKISNENSCRVYFGDYEQAIFSFMGAKLEILDKIAQNSEIHTLTYNFRSSKKLLNLYNQYAKKWLNPKWKTEPIAINDYESQVKYKIIKGNQHNEPKYIVNNIIPKLNNQQTAILVRTNKSADMFSKYLTDNNLSYFKISGFDLFRRQIVKDLMAFFNIIINPDDKNSWIRLFHLYGKIKTLKESRNFINEMFKIGLRPLDLLNDDLYLEKVLNSFSKRIVVFDTETTGLDTDNDDIIQIAAVEIINGKIGKTFEIFIKTDKDLVNTEEIHHISKYFLERYGVSKEEGLNKFLDFIKDDILIAHNLEYDKNILNSNLKKINLKSINNEMFDSIEITKRLYPTLNSYKLEYLLNYFEIEGINSHNALDDVKATVNLLLFLKDKLNNNILDEFIENHTKTIKIFKDRFEPIYKAIVGKFSDYLPLDEIVLMVISYMTDHLNVKADEKLYQEIDKLLRHMRINNKNLSQVIHTIKKHIPEYSKYSEADLIIGDEKIVVATIHKAKGLEFENVIIPSVVNDVFPNYYSNTREKKLEDAKLLYVAMTRTKKNILFTSYTHFEGISKWGNPYSFYRAPSVFIKPFFDSIIENGEIE